MSLFKTHEFRNWLSQGQNKILLVAMLSFILIASIISYFNQEAASTKIEQNLLTADTVIPEGAVLIPVELINGSAVGSLMGEYGIVDLFTTANNINSGLRVASHVRLIRAPLNSDQFAILVPEQESVLILKNPGPFFAVIQNPSQSKKISIRNKIPKRPNIEYFN